MCALTNFNIVIGNRQAISRQTTKMGDEHKEQGNKLFLARRFDEAISCYSKAIVILFLNFKQLCNLTTPSIIQSLTEMIFFV